MIKLLCHVLAALIIAVGIITALKWGKQHELATIQTGYNKRINEQYQQTINSGGRQGNNRLFYRQEIVLNSESNRTIQRQNQ